MGLKRTRACVRFPFCFMFLTDFPLAAPVLISCTGWLTQKIHNLSPMNAACNIQSNCTFLVSYWKRVTAGQVYWKRVTAGQVFVLRPPVVSRSENRIHQCQAIKFFNNIQAFSNLSVGGNTKCSALCTVRLGVLPGMPANMWARNIEHLTCLC